MKYEKPISIDLGQPGTFVGCDTGSAPLADCDNGVSPTSSCGMGDFAAGACARHGNQPFTKCVSGTDPRM